MTDIWDEKPIAILDEFYRQGDKFDYPAEEMDAWLEKVKAECDELKEKADVYDSWQELIRIDFETFHSWRTKAEKWDKVLSFGRIQKAKGLDGETSEAPTYAELIDKLEDIKKLTEVHGLVIPTSKILKILEGEE